MKARILSLIAATMLISMGCRPSELIQFRVQVNVADGAQFGTASFDVSEGKRLLIRHVSGDITLPTGQRGVVVIRTTPDFAGQSTVLNNWFPLTWAGANISVGPQAESYYFTEHTSLFTDGTVSVALVRGPSPPILEGQAWADVTISGQLVDIPS
jgi:hypothetical protein